MKLTKEMLDAGVKKAIEAGLLPRHAGSAEMAVNQDLIRLVVQAALDAVPARSGNSALPVSLRQFHAGQESRAKGCQTDATEHRSWAPVFALR